MTAHRKNPRQNLAPAVVGVMAVLVAAALSVGLIWAIISLLAVLASNG